jgi:hypothetical protein
VFGVECTFCVNTGKQWELRNCKQQPGESLREYIRCFSKSRTELLGATDNDAFQNKGFW